MLPINDEAGMTFTQNYRNNHALFLTYGNKKEGGLQKKLSLETVWNFAINATKITDNLPRDCILIPRDVHTSVNDL
jgi:hypothetical protein